MAYVRGDPRNFDDWARQGCAGWSYEEVLPFFKKSENLVGRDLGPAHGRGDPLTVSQTDDADFSGKALCHTWLEACKNVGMTQLDYNGPDQTGVNLIQSTCHNGVRCDTASAFLFNTGAMQRANLTVVVDTQVLKVNVDGCKRATGVSLEVKGQVITVDASKEVILSGGAVGSAHLLLLSGIGPAEELKEHGIECVQDLPVGKNLQDHLMVPMSWKVKKERQPFAPINKLTGGVIPDLFRHMVTGTGNLSIPPLHGTAFYHSGLPGHDACRGNDTQIHFVAFGATDAQTMERNLGMPKPGPKFTAYLAYSLMMLPILLLPRSTGYIKLASADPKKHPIIDPQYFEDPRDLEVVVQGAKKVREIAASAPFAGILEEEIYDDADEHLMSFDRNSDEYLRALCAKTAATVYHPVGTAKMGSRDDPTAVVDPELRVRGVAGLRVADASVMPTVISGNTNAPCIMIGERCAAFIRSC